MSRSFCAFVLLAACAIPASAQEPVTTEERIKALEQENRRIVERLRATEERNVLLESRVRTLSVETDELREEEREAELGRSINAMSARLQDAKWITATRSGLPIRFYGFIRFDAYYNTARANSIIIPAWVLPENDVVAEGNDDHFAFDARLTRFAVDVDAGQIGDAKVLGKLEIDFANFPAGIPESRETPRIRLAYIDMDFSGFSIRLGQDWDIIAPLFPQANAELLMWNNGNLGDRRPMAQFRFQSGEASGTLFTARLAAGLTGAIDNGDLDVGVTPAALTSTERDGFDSGHPHGQARLGLDFNSWVEKERASIGAWGYVAGLETDNQFAGEDHFTPWTVGVDWTIPLVSKFALRGELFYGQALSDVRGTIGQVINPATGEEIEGFGGWVELTWQATDCLKLFVGGTMDNPDGGDVPTGGRDLNWSLYVASVYNWGGGLKTGLDVIYWETDWDGPGIGNMVRVNFYTQLDF